MALNKILMESGSNWLHILLNLVGFCMEELPLKNDHYKKYSSLFEMWDNACEYKDVRSGERIFNRVNSELEILVAIFH